MPEQTPPALPIAPLYLHPHSVANEPLLLHEGPVVVHHAAGTTRGRSTLSLQWQPRTGLRLKMDLESDDLLDIQGQVRVDIAGGTAATFLSSLRHHFGEDGRSQAAEAGIRFIETGSPDNFVSMGFQVVNFPDFMARGAVAAPDFGMRLTSVRTSCPGWIVEMAAVENSIDIYKSLKATGGYAFTHIGRIRREDGVTFSAADAEPVIGALHSFFGFARGAACGIPIQWGLSFNGTVCWERWGSSVMTAWGDRQPWFDEHHGNLLAEIFPAFFQMHNDADQRPPLKLALHWYMKSSNRDGGMEGAIILGFTALDLLGALVVVGRAGLLNETKYDDLKAHQKIRALLNVLKVPEAIPAHRKNLVAFAASNNWIDAASALSEIRHGYVHPNAKRRAVVLNAPNLAIFEAWQLCLWYQELALLFLLNHQGDYRNRLTAEWVGQVEKVPWAAVDHDRRSVLE